MAILTALFIEKIIVSLAIGALVGTERQHTKHQLMAGVRTFALISLLGTLFVSFGQLLGSNLVPIVGFISVLIFAAILYAGNLVKTQALGLTTVVALLITYIMGTLVGFGRFEEAIFITIAMAFILFAKQKAHQFIEHIKESELLDLLELLALLGIVFPILPKAPILVLGLPIDLGELWFLIVLLVGINFVGFLASRRFQEVHKVELTAFIGGLVSSTVTAFKLSEAHLHDKKKDQILVPAFLMSQGAANIRNLFIIGAIAPITLKVLSLPLLVGSAILIGMSHVLLNSKRINIRKVKTTKPFGVAKSAVLAAKLFAILIVLQAIVIYIPDIFFVAALAGGLVSGMATFASIGSLLATQSVSMQSAAIAASFAILGNVLSNYGIFLLADASSSIKKSLPYFLVAGIVYSALLYFTLGLI